MKIVENLTPKLHVYHRLRGPLVDRIVDLFEAEYGTRAVEVFATADTHTPEKWRVTATSQSVMFIGKPVIMAGSSGTILEGLVTVHRLLKDGLYNRSKRLELAILKDFTGPFELSWDFDGDSILGTGLGDVSPLREKNSSGVDEVKTPSS
jgi:hypothetical protein